MKSTIIDMKSTGQGLCLHNGRRYWNSVEALMTTVFTSILLLGASLALSQDALGTTVNVAPCKGAEACYDADNIENALNSVGASGGVVQLSKGIYRIERPIYVEDFHGTLQGAGEQNSIIIGVGDATRPFPMVPKLLPVTSYGIPLSNSYLVFVNPKVSLTIKNLKLQVPEPLHPQKIETYFFADPVAIGPFLLSFIDIRFDNPLGSTAIVNADTTIEGVQMTGSALDSRTGYFNDFTQAQPVWGIMLKGSSADDRNNFTSSGHHLIKNNKIENTMIQALVYRNFINSVVDITDNKFDNLKSVNLNFFSGSTINVLRNKFTDAHMLPQISVGSENYEITGADNIVNVISNEVESDTQILELGGGNLNNPDFAEAKITVEDNHFQLIWPGVVGGVFDAKGAKIQCNVASGKGSGGFGLSGLTNSLISQNDLTKLNVGDGYEYVLGESFRGGCSSGNLLQGYGEFSVDDSQCPGLNTVTKVNQLNCQ